MVNLWLYYFLTIEEIAQQKEEKTMANFNNEKPFRVGDTYYSSEYRSLDEALANARDKAVEDRKDIAVFKAVKIVKFPTTEASSLKVENVA